MVEDPVVAQIVGRLKELYQPYRIYLFGSAARGEATPESDYDFMVVVADEAAPNTHPPGRPQLGVDRSVDVKVQTWSEFYKRLHLKASLPATIVREGALVYSSGSDPVREADAKQWLEKASQHLRGCESVLRLDPPLTALAMFLAQQAVEKVMKAFLCWHDVPFKKTHELAELGKLCAQRDATLGDELEPAFEFSSYAWEFRYPGVPDPTYERGNEVLETARRTVAAILTRLPAEARP